MKPIIVDASIAAKWFLPEEGSRAAIRLLNKRYRLLAPDLLRIEFGNVLWKAVGRGALARDEAEEILQQFLATPLEIHDSESLLPVAMDVALETRITVYDGLYVALALQQDAVCVTADKRLVRALASTSFSRWVHLLDRSR